MNKLLYLYLLALLFNANISAGQSLDSISNEQKHFVYHTIKLWGFMKYYHPDAAAGAYDMNEELLDLLHQGLDSPEDAIGSYQHLLAWFHKFSQDFPHVEEVNDSVAVALKPDFSWTRKEPFTEISSDINSIIHADRPDGHHYFELIRGVGNPKFKNDDHALAMDYHDDFARVLGLANYWNKIEYFFPYKYLTDHPWDSVLVAFIPKMIEADNQLDYKLTLIELFGSISDGHADLWHRDQLLTRYWGEKSLPLKITFIEDQPVIKEVFTMKIKGNTRIQPGDVLVEVDAQPVEKLMEEKIRYTPASNRAAQFRKLEGKLLRTNNDTMKILLKRGDTFFEEWLNTIYLGQMPGRPPKPTSHLMEKYNIGYIYPGSLKEGEIDTIMQDFMSTNGLIIDFRCYPTDFIVFSLSKYLTPKPTRFVKFSSTSYQDPGVFQFTKALSVGSTNPDYYKGRVVIIINELTQSSAEYHTMAFRVAPNATVIGSQTAGADGNVSEIMMPGWFKTMISGIGVYNPDGTDTQRVGIVPDIEVKPTVEGIREGKDELLEKAIELIEGKM